MTSEESIDQPPNEDARLQAAMELNHRDGPCPNQTIEGDPEDAASRVTIGGEVTFRFPRWGWCTGTVLEIDVRHGASVRWTGGDVSTLNSSDTKKTRIKFTNNDTTNGTITARLGDNKRKQRADTEPASPLTKTSPPGASTVHLVLLLGGGGKAYRS